MNLDGHTCFKKQNNKLTLKVPNIQCKYHHLKFLAPLAASLKILHLKKKKKDFWENLGFFSFQNDTLQGNLRLSEKITGYRICTHIQIENCVYSTVCTRTCKPNLVRGLESAFCCVLVFFKGIGQDFWDVCLFAELDVKQEAVSLA